MNLEKLASELIEAEKAFIMYHVSPDPDAIGSAIALARILRKMGKTVEVFKEKNMNDQVKAMVEFSGESLVERPSFDPDLVVVVDTSAKSMINDIILELPGRKIAIDHHAKKDNGDEVFDETFVDESAIATAIIINELANHLGIPLDPVTARLLGIAIITDSANFVIADSRMFKNLSEIVKIVDYQALISIANMPLDFSERVARLKAAGRAKLHFINTYIIATTKSPAFEGSIARALIELGADVSFVLSTGDPPRLSARARQDLVKAGLHLGKDVMPKIAELFGGDGGGHAGAAGANGFDKGKSDQVLETCVNIVADFIQSIED